MFPYFYHMTGMKYTLEFITDFAQTVPCYELQFTPDQRAIDEVLNHVKKTGCELDQYKSSHFDI